MKRSLAASPSAQVWGLWSRPRSPAPRRGNRSSRQKAAFVAILAFAFTFLSLGVLWSLQSEKWDLLSSRDRPSSLPLKGHDLLFVLAGQSNMAGRGYAPPSILSAASPRVFRFSAEGSWEGVSDKTYLHGDIDTKKRVGLGPAKAFANAVLENTQANSILLVPCAIGGTSLAEWMPTQNSTLSSSSSSPKMSTLIRVRRGFLYESMLARTRLAFRAFFSSSEPRDSILQKPVLAGILWYQGENDACTTEEHALSYSSRFEPWLGRTRSDLDSIQMEEGWAVLKEDQGGGMPLPVILATVNADVRLETCPHMKLVKFSQESILLPGVHIISTTGLPLNSDNLHLTSFASEQVGLRMANAFLRSLR